ncbi:hypothetical protein DMX03_13000 [Pseudomonas koreensis]|nr:hypothetical protein DMX03_13000 [Pseudomonas koreensis]PYC06638.1 hypothetical protein DMX04_02065 [Pseudomonas koreensis]
MPASSAQFGDAHTRSSSAACALPCAAMARYLRRFRSSSSIVLPQLPSCVSAKQNGFWQIVR